MDTTEATKLHPLHALYLGQNHGEVATFVRRARFAQTGAAAANGPATPDRPAALVPGLGLAAALAAALQGGAPTGGR